MKKILKISALVLSLFAVIFILIGANHAINEQEMEDPQIELTAQDEIALITEKELKEEIYRSHLFQAGMKKSEMNIKEIEAFVEGMNEVKYADVYTELGAVWHIKTITRHPLIRVVLKEQDDFYIDNDFEVMQMSPFSKPKILTVTGMEQLLGSSFAYDSLINNDSLKTKYNLDQIYRISKYICSDAFYNAQIVQVYYTKEDGFVLVPRVGRQRIIFGKARSEEEVAEKFRKLTTFYKEVIPYQGWATYETINLNFENQIVATKTK